MSDLILPPMLAVLLTAFTPCFQARSVVVFQWLVLGWIQCQGRRTLTDVALASGAVGERHISVFHRFFSRASWTLDALGRVVFTLALTWLPADQPLVVLGDDTLARKGGKSIALASMHHDPLLSSARKPSPASGTCGWCWRSGCRCPSAVGAASRCRCCSACTSAPNVAVSGIGLANGKVGLVLG